MFRLGLFGLLISVFVLVSFQSQAYVEEEVRFAAGGGITLKGYLAKPADGFNHPALVIQMGHGEGSTDNSSEKYNPFADLSRELADQGFVVLRFDKRGTGYNSKNGSYADGLFTDYVSDLKGAVALVESRPEVNPSAVFLMGHSLGGPVVSIVARDLPTIKGIILVAAPQRSFGEFNLEQMNYLFELGANLKGDMLAYALQRVKRSNELIDSPEDFCKEFPDQCQRKNGKIYLWGQVSDFWKEVKALDPLEVAKSVNCQVFGLYGTSDWLISSDHDGGALNAALEQNPKFSFLAVPKMDHFLLPMDSKKASVEAFVGGFKNTQLAIHPEFMPALTAKLKSWIAQ